MTNSFYMHPKYQEFLGSIKNLESDARVNPNALNLAFDVWLLGGNMSESQIEWLKAENERLTKENEQLVRDMHRIAKQTFGDMTPYRAYMALKTAQGDVVTWHPVVHASCNVLIALDS